MHMLHLLDVCHFHHALDIKLYAFWIQDVQLWDSILAILSDFGRCRCTAMGSHFWYFGLLLAPLGSHLAALRAEGLPYRLQGAFQVRCATFLGAIWEPLGTPSVAN